MDFDANFKLYKKLMPYRVREILIISSPYDAFIMEEDGGLMEHVFINYRGVSLIYPPTFTLVSTAKEALQTLKDKNFDLVITMPRFLGMDVMALGRKIKKIKPQIPVVVLARAVKDLNKYRDKKSEESIDRIFIWSGNRNILWAIIKWLEDRMNVTADTQTSMVRVLIVVEDSPFFYSSLLSILYESILQQTLAVLEDSLNEEHRLLKLRARPKILLASNYEEGMELFQRFKPYLLGIFSDVRYPKDGKVNKEAGIIFLSDIRKTLLDLPILLMSSEINNKEKAEKIGANFLDKNSPSLHLEIRRYLMDHLGFGDFVFRLPNNQEVGRAIDLRSLEDALHSIPDESLIYHATWNHFSSWLMAHAEIMLAMKFRKFKYTDFERVGEVRKFLIENIHEKRIRQQRGVVAFFRHKNFDADSDFLKIGDGSLGGKARGLAFMAKLLQNNVKELDRWKNLKIKIPKTMVVTTECFDRFIIDNDLQDCAKRDFSDESTATKFIKAELPVDIEIKLRIYLEKIKYPLAIRSSSLLEDDLYKPCAGLYKTYMLPNNHPDIEERLRQLTMAIRLIYASVYYRGPKAFSKSTMHRVEEEKMAIIIQQVVGKKYGDYFYPAISGVTQSYNFYPISHLKPEDGIANIALGLGKFVVEGGRILRYPPKFPQILPQFSNVDDILEGAQRHFYALSLKNNATELWISDEANLEKREVTKATDEYPIQFLSSSYFPSDHLIRDVFSSDGNPIITFANILKYNHLPLNEVLIAINEIGKTGLGCDVEMEFAVNLSSDPKEKSEFILLQARPMRILTESAEARIEASDIEKAFCFSTNALGLGFSEDINTIIMVKPEAFLSQNTVNIAKEISHYNALLEKENKKYLLAGSGRWGSADHNLGVPVSWEDISQVGGIVEISTENFRADPSQGTHFFQNITSLGIVYFTVYRNEDFFKWDCLKKQKIVKETDYLYLIETSSPIEAMINGKKNHGVLIIK